MQTKQPVKRISDACGLNNSQFPVAANQHIQMTVALKPNHGDRTIGDYGNKTFRGTPAA